MQIPQVSNGRIINFTEKKWSIKESTTANYDYLIKMSLLVFTEDELHKLEEQINKLQKEFDLLESKSIENMWTEECKEFLKHYKKYKLKS